MFEQFSTPPTSDMYILLRIISLVFFLHNQIYDHTVFVIVLHILVFIYLFCRLSVVQQQRQRVFEGHLFLFM